MIPPICCLDRCHLSVSRGFLGSNMLHSHACSSKAAAYRLCPTCSCLRLSHALSQPSDRPALPVQLATAAVGVLAANRHCFCLAQGHAPGRCSSAPSHTWRSSARLCQVPVVIQIGSPTQRVYRRGPASPKT